MRLLYITNKTTKPGGLERALSIKASYFADSLGYDVHIVTLNDEDEQFYNYSPKISFHNLRTKGKFLRYLCTYIKGLKVLIKSIEPDIISVCDDGLKGFFVPLIIRKCCPIIYERHVSKKIELAQNDNYFLKNILAQIKFYLMNWRARAFDKFVILTEQSQNEWKLGNLIVIPNPLPFYPENPSSLRSKKIIAVGKLSYQKGYDLLLKAEAKVFNRHPDWTQEIYGSTRGKEGLLDLAKKLGISNNVILHEPTKDIENKYLEASILVLSSRFEGFGMTIIEAMACGIPVVSFDCPFGPADLLENNEGGFLIRNFDLNVLAEKINLLIEDEDLRKKMGAKARESVKAYFPDRICRKWDELFNALIKK